MPDLDTFLRTRPEFDLEELAHAANELLPKILPDDPVDARVKPEVNPRLIRHYAGEGLLDAPLREGKRAIYTVDHLLQLLALRRLLADGLSSTAIGESLREKERDELRGIAEGRSDTAVFSAASGAPGRDDARSRARAALAAIRGDVTGSLHSRVEPSSAPPEPEHDRPPPLASSSAHGSDAAESWERVPLLDGVELHVRDDVRLPRSPEARSRLLDHVIREIVRYAQGRDR